jgi:hypothetical protein
LPAKTQRPSEVQLLRVRPVARRVRVRSAFMRWCGVGFWKRARPAGAVHGCQRIF